MLRKLVGEFVFKLLQLLLEALNLVGVFDLALHLLGVAMHQFPF